MMINEDSRLFEEFDAVSKETWKQKIIHDLKGGNFEKLVWHTDEGFSIQPFYTPSDMEGVGYLKAYQSIAAHNHHTRHWENREIIQVNKEKEANKEALHVLNHGADGIVLDLRNNKYDLNELLKGIILNYCSLSFISNYAISPQLIEDYLKYARQQEVKEEELTGAINYDPIALWTVNGKLESIAFETLAHMVSASAQSAGFRVLTINSSQFHNAGASAVQELAFTLSTAVSYINHLTDLGLSPAEVIKNIEFSIAVGSSYFTEIAKLRALRILFYQIIQSYEVDGIFPGDIHIHCISSTWNKTIFDPGVNMLRNTSEAMAAIIGGCNALSIQAHDTTVNIPSAFSKRIARNISTLLKEESYFNKVIDPAAGSFYLENLTDLIAENSWRLFQEIEKEEGFIAAFNKGIIQQKIQSVSSNKLEKVAHRKEVIVGVNQYASAEETSGAVHENKYFQADPELLKPLKKSGKLEQIRLQTEKYIREGGKVDNIRVHILPLGTSALAKSRVAFSAGFMVTGGFKVTEGIFVDMEESLKDAVQSAASAIIICGSDDDYVKYANKFITDYRAENLDKILLVAGDPERIASLSTIDLSFEVDFIHLDSNMVAVLQNMQQRLKVT